MTNLKTSCEIRKSQKHKDQIKIWEITYVGFIPFFVLRFLAKVTKKRKSQLSFSDKMQIFSKQKINKQGSWVFRFWSLWPKNEIWKMKWTGQKLSNLIQRRSQVLRSNTLDFDQAWFWLKRTKNMAWWTSYHQHHFWSLSLLSITYNKVHIINAFPIELWRYFSSYALYLKAW